MKKMLLLFSHSLTPEQKYEAENNLSAKEFLSLPYDLQSLWSQVPPEGEINDTVRLFIEWIKNHGIKGDIALIQGEFGMTFAIADWCLRHGITPVYSTTRREYEQTEEDGRIVNRHVFKHVRFREYRRL
ncbi:MAG: CRISPR-associated protein Csx20 [Candidatus Eremiobacterota bacterium]